MKHAFDRADRIASLKIIIIYSLFAALWIYFSDNALGLLIRDQELLVRLSVLKGFLFIIVTAALLYQLIFRYLRKTRAVEQDLHASRNLINTLIEGTTDAIFVKDRAGRYLLFNTAAANVVGKSADQVIGHDDTFLFSPEEATALMAGDRRVMESGRVMTYEDYLTNVDGSRRTFLSTKGPIFDGEGTVSGLFGISRDITEQKQLEEQLLHSQKMDAIGQLAGGVAHDLNNILTVIYGYCGVLQMRMEINSPYRSEIDLIYGAAERAANLTRSLLAFSRKQIIHQKNVNLNDIVINVGSLLTRIIGEDIELNTHSTTNPLTVFADSGQIEHVLLNLAANARDAMPHGGKLTIETMVRDIDEEFIHEQGFGSPGKYAVISVTDTGMGMDANTCKKIFEPFFTTKDIGQGTGLGLSIVYGVITQHNGYISVASEPDKGTVFQIYLPQVFEDYSDDNEETPLDFPQMGTETVLVAEDDPSIRQLTASVLEEFGYNVMLAQDGMDAVGIFKAASEKIDIIIMDLVMPGKSGKEAYEEIINLRPDVKILFMSGYSPDILLNKGFLDTGEEVIIKPVQPLELIRRVRAALDKVKGDSQ